MDFDGLNRKFHDKLYEFIDRCIAQDLALEFETGFVHPLEQARLWKQSRSDSEIDAQIGKLREEKANFLADLLMKAKGRAGPHLTDNLPGFSWHNWGMAYTFCILGEDGRPIISGNKIYGKAAEIARALGLTSGFYFKPKQAFLVQLPQEKMPSNAYTIEEINKAMERMYGDNK